MDQSQHNIQSILQRAMALHQQGDVVRAEEMYREVLGLVPDEPNAWHLLGVVALQRDDLQLAETHIRKAIKINNRAPIYHINLAGVLQQKGDVEGAITHYEQALKLSPNDENISKQLAQLLHTHAMDLAQNKQWDKACACYRRVLELDPNNIATLNNLASIIQHLGDRPGARALYGRALSIAPDRLLLRYNRATCYLTEGLLQEGWEDFAASEPYWRDKQDNRPGILPWMIVPLWNGKDDLKGKKILIWGDQGIGDEIVYASGVPDLIERGALVTIECNPRLVPLYQRSFPTAIILARVMPPLPGAEFDFHAPGMWLARCLHPIMDSFSPRPFFLKADPEKTEQLRERYRALGKKRIVGISWFTQSQAWGSQRSVQLRDLLAALPLDDVTLVDLQYGDTAGAWGEAQKMFPNLTIIRDSEIDQLKNMDAYAAQVAACDFVVTICNTTSHVAGALGVPAAVFMTDAGLTWYWFEKIANCPWYPSITFLRLHLPDRLKAAGEWLQKRL